MPFPKITWGVKLFIPKDLNAWFNRNLYLPYASYTIRTCSTDSAWPHLSHFPVSCFPILCRHWFSKQCPIRILDIKTSSFLLPYFLLSLPTFYGRWYKCLHFLPLSHSFCHFFLISFAINPFTSVLLIDTLMSNCACFKASLARWSASSFPSTPMCDGTHMKFTISPDWLILNKLCITWNIISCLAVAFPLNKLFKTEKESVQITDLIGCTYYIHWRARNIAIISVVKTDIWSEILFEIFTLNWGI